jgi:hypothetical protein
MSQRRASNDTIISAKHGLTDEELKFVRVFLAMGSVNAAEAFRRAWADDCKDMHSREVSRRAKQLLKQDYIIRYIEELKAPTSDAARGVLVDQILFGEDQQALRAAQKSIEEEDKLGFGTAVDRFWEISSEIGAEIVVTLPGEVTREVVCPHCFDKHVVTIPLEVTAPVSEMFGGGEKEEES